LLIAGSFIAVYMHILVKLGSNQQVHANHIIVLFLWLLFYLLSVPICSSAGKTMFLWAMLKLAMFR